MIDVAIYLTVWKRLNRYGLQSDIVFGHKRYKCSITFLLFLETLDVGLKGVKFIVSKLSQFVKV